MRKSRVGAAELWLGQCRALETGGACSSLQDVRRLQNTFALNVQASWLSNSELGFWVWEPYLHPTTQKEDRCCVLFYIGACLDRLKRKPNSSSRKDKALLQCRVEETSGFLQLSVTSNFQQAGMDFLMRILIRMSFLPIVQLAMTPPLFPLMFRAAQNCACSHHFSYAALRRSATQVTHFEKWIHAGYGHPPL